MCLFTVVPAYADGLIFQLPADGTWARCAVQIEGEFKVGKQPTQKFATTGTLTVSSVGEVTRHEQKCRWIELNMESKFEGMHRKLDLKMLIPEEYLKRGQDPLSHAVTTFFNPKAADKLKSKPADIDEGFN